MYKISLLAKNLFILLVLLCVFVSCSEDTKEKSISTGQKSEFSELKNFEDSILSVGKIASSLRYEKSDGSTYQVSAHLSKNDEVLMLEEKISEPKSFLFQANQFFFKNGSLFASKELVQKSLDSISAPKFTETLAFYKNNKVQKAFTKNASSEDEILKANYQDIEYNGVSFEKAQRALNQQGEFVTNFQGFVFQNDAVYIVVGQASEDSYSTALKVNNKDDLVYFLLKDQKKYLNRKLKIIFEIVEEPNGFTYQSYLQGTFSD